MESERDSKQAEAAKRMQALLAPYQNKPGRWVWLHNGLTENKIYDLPRAEDGEYKGFITEEPIGAKLKDKPGASLLTAFVCWEVVGEGEDVVGETGIIHGIAERKLVEETDRAARYLNLYGYGETAEMAIWKAEQCLARLDQMPSYGVILQLLAIDILKTWWENCCRETIEVAKWLDETFTRKVVEFACYQWSERDKCFLGPLVEILEARAGEAIAEVERRICSQPDPGPQPAPDDEADTTTGLPSELDTPEGRELLHRAIEAGLAEVTAGKYRWKGTKALLAYFAERATEYLGIGKVDLGGRTAVCNKPFENLFAITGLRAATNERRNKTGRPPRGYKQIDLLFSSRDTAPRHPTYTPHIHPT